MSHIVEKCPLLQCLRILKGILDLDTDVDDFQYLISSSSSTGEDELQ